jgi:homocysteine S-methyltransferase
VPVLEQGRGAEVFVTTGSAFLARLAGGALVADGAMGTMLWAERSPRPGCLEELNLSAPGAVERLHREYVKAGAELVQTNTFGANRLRLAPYELTDRVAAINRAGVEIARRAAGRGVFVVGSVGPLGCGIAGEADEGSGEAEEGSSDATESGWPRITAAQAREAFREQTLSLVSAGVDAILLETFSNLQEIGEALMAAREVGGATPVMAQFTVSAGGKLRGGLTVAQALASLERWDPGAVGCNCSEGPASIESSLALLLTAGKRPVIAQPSAGLPSRHGEQMQYPWPPKDFGAWAAWAFEAGVHAVGGCCGTTPDHIREVRAAAGEHQRRRAMAPTPASGQAAQCR